jgi:O-antigen/teichoic acid export membrane protein
VGYFLSEFETGIYQSVSLIAVLFIAILSSFKTMVAPMIADSFHQDNQKELKLTMRTSTRWVFNLCLPLFLIILAVPEAFMTTLFGEAYLIGSQTLVILTLAQLINIGKGPIDQLLIMTGNQRVWFKITFIAFIVNIAANWILIPIYGLTGAAVANVSTFAGLAAGGLYFSNKCLGFLPFDQFWVRSLLITIVTAAALIAIKLTFQISDGLELLVAAIVSVLLFYGFLLWAGLSEDDRVFLKVVINTIKKQ